MLPSIWRTAASGKRCSHSSPHPTSSSRPQGRVRWRSSASMPIQIVRITPGLVWISITGHGAVGEASRLGRDLAMTVASRAASAPHCGSATGRTGFVGDAIADPLTGVFAALAAWRAWTSRRGVRLGLAMSHVVARCLAAARHENPEALQSCLRTWEKRVGKPFPTSRGVPYRHLPLILRQYSSVSRARGALRAQTLPDTRIEAPVIARAALG